MSERSRVLIVDDEPQNLAVLARVLAPEYEVLIAPSGARALELARGASPPDLMLLDVVMPELDGYEVLRRLQADAATRDLPVLFVSGLDTTADEERGLALGAVDYLAKPYRPPVILARVATHLALKRARDALARRGAELEVEVERRTRELQRATEVAQAGDRAKSEFLATMSHELRTPLGGVLGMAELLRQSGLSEQQREDIGALEESARGLLAIIDAILEYSEAAATPGASGRGACRVRELARSVVEPFEADAAARGTALEQSVSPEVPQVTWLDQARLARVLQVLLRNALAFTRAGHVALVVMLEDERTLSFSVRDTGVGMSSEVLRRLFVPFTQGDGGRNRAHPGIGLGLALAQRLVERLGGTLAVSSAPGVGSTFVVKVPFEGSLGVA